MTLLANQTTTVWVPSLIHVGALLTVVLSIWKMNDKNKDRQSDMLDKLDTKLDSKLDKLDTKLDTKLEGIYTEQTAISVAVAQIQKDVERLQDNKHSSSGAAYPELPLWDDPRSSSSRTFGAALGHSTRVPTSAGEYII